MWFCWRKQAGKQQKGLCVLVPGMWEETRRNGLNGDNIQTLHGTASAELEPTEETLLTGKDYAPGVSNPDRKAPVQPGFLSYLLSTKGNWGVS